MGEEEKHYTSSLPCGKKHLAGTCSGQCSLPPAVPRLRLTTSQSQFPAHHSVFYSCHHRLLPLAGSGLSQCSPFGQWSYPLWCVQVRLGGVIPLWRVQVRHGGVIPLCRVQVRLSGVIPLCRVQVRLSGVIPLCRVQVRLSGVIPFCPVQVRLGELFLYVTARTSTPVFHFRAQDACQIPQPTVCVCVSGLKVGTTLAKLV